MKVEDFGVVIHLSFWWCIKQAWLCLWCRASPIIVNIRPDTFEVRNVKGARIIYHGLRLKKHQQW